MHKLLWPIKGIGLTPGIFISQTFGQNLNDYAQFGMKGHNGIDIAAPKGTPVLASHDGDLEQFTEYDPSGKLFKGYGINAKIYYTENGQKYELIYGHFDRWEGENRAVKEGDVIGYVDSTGFSTGHHLHFAIRKWNANSIENYDNGYFGCIDPLPFMKVRAFLTGYRKHPEKDITFRLDNMDRLHWFFEQVPAMSDVFQIEETEFTMPMDKPPFPTP